MLRLYKAYFTLYSIEFVFLIRKNLQIRRCINTNGSFICELIPPCQRGYRRAFNGTCSDIDECSENLHNCRLDLYQYCINKDGEFECLTRLPSCSPGYRYSLSTRRCEDINECSTGQYNCDVRLSERCVNLPGTYRYIFHC